jgi:Fe2+ transport system protein FeoA
MADACAVHLGLGDRLLGLGVVEGQRLELLLHDHGQLAAGQEVEVVEVV